MSELNFSNVPKGGNAFTGWLGETLLKLSGWTLNGTLPNHPKMVIAVGPHTSNWDFVIGVYALFALRIRIRFLAKHTLFMHIAKQLLDLIGGFPVDRKASHGVVQQVAEQFAQQEKMILAIAPEGTRSPIYPWKTGFLTIAHKAKVPVILLAFDYKRKSIEFGPTIVTTGDIDKDMKKVYRYFSTIVPKYKDKCVLR